MVLIGLSPTLINTLTFGEEEGNSHGLPVHSVDKNSSDIETIINTTKHYKKTGKPSSEINAQSPAVSHISLFPKVNPQSTMTQKRKSPSNKSGDDE